MWPIITNWPYIDFKQSIHNYFIAITYFNGSIRMLIDLWNGLNIIWKSLSLPKQVIKLCGPTDRLNKYTLQINTIKLNIDRTHVKSLRNSATIKWSSLLPFLVFKLVKFFCGVNLLSLVDVTIQNKKLRHSAYADCLILRFPNKNINWLTIPIKILAIAIN